MSFDINGARVVGAIKGRGVRAFYTDGHLYVAHSLTKVDALACDTPTAWGSGGFMVHVGGQTTTVQRPSCGCQRKKDLGQATQEQLIATASVSV